MKIGMVEGFINIIDDYNRDKTINEYFEAMVEKVPDNIAIKSGGIELTYLEFNALSNKLARTLANRGVGQGDTVAIYFERSIQMMISIMALLKLGAPYIPVGFNVPEDRIRYILKDSNVKLFFVQSRKFAFYNDINILVYEEISLHFNGANLNSHYDNSNVAYIMYTSGSTGIPKGVMVSQKSVINHILWRIDQGQLSDKDVFFQKTPYTFDISVWEIFLWFFVGAKLCLCQNGKESNVEYLLSEIKANNVTACQFVPSMLLEILKYAEHKKSEEKLSSLKVVFSGGEVLQSSTVSLFFKLLTEKYGTLLYNVYGPTEATIDTTFYCCNNLYNEKIPDNISIGVPIWNSNIYIVDETYNLCEEDVEGEIYIGGAGVALGYVGAALKNDSSFISNPWHHGRIYKTGDIGKISNGQITFCGRKDKQIKIRGMRVELEEIESVINGIDGIRQSVVVYNNKLDSVVFKAHYVAERDISENEISSCIGKWLPEYMIPTSYERVEHLEYTSSGKINRDIMADMLSWQTQKYECQSEINVCNSQNNIFNNSINTFRYENNIIVKESADSFNCLSEQERKILNIICESIGICNNISADTKLIDVGVDSLHFISLIIELENNFNFEFDGDMLLADAYPTIYAMVRYVNSTIK